MTLDTALQDIFWEYGRIKKDYQLYKSNFLMDDAGKETLRMEEAARMKDANSIFESLAREYNNRVLVFHSAGEVPFRYKVLDKESYLVEIGGEREIRPYDMIEVYIRNRVVGLIAAKQVEKEDPVTGFSVDETLVIPIVRKNLIERIKEFFRKV